MFAPEKPHRVYCSTCWWSDAWDPMDYGKDYDTKRPFFDQLKELLLEVPMMGLSVEHTTLVNSDYINEASSCRNCYLVFNADYCENSLYGTSLSNTKDVMDALILGESELCYEIINCGKCFNCYFSEDLVSCHDIYFSKNLVGCDNCFGCVNLRNKSHHIWNKAYTKEAYQEEFTKIKQRFGYAKE